MNKQATIQAITKSVRGKHPWHIRQDKYLTLFGSFPKEYLEEKIHYDNLLEKIKQFKLCELRIDDIRINIKLTLDELIIYELGLDKWQEAKIHNIYPSDIKKQLNE